LPTRSPDGATVASVFRPAISRDSDVGALRAGVTSTTYVCAASVVPDDTEPSTPLEDESGASSDEEESLTG